jgi:cytochrome c-type biogenesis protein CcmH
MGLNPPAEIQQVLIQRIAEWRGESLPTAPAAAPEPASQPAPIENADFIISADISLSAIAAESLPADATVFVIARDPGQPGPPIAVTRRRLSELPDTIQLDDSDSMIPGRSLSGFPQFELVARVSLSGQPVQQSGDWFGAQIVKPEENARITLSIDQRVP